MSNRRLTSGRSSKGPPNPKPIGQYPVPRTYGLITSAHFGSACHKPVARCRVDQEGVVVARQDPTIRLRAGELGKRDAFAL